MNSSDTRFRIGDKAWFCSVWNGFAFARRCTVIGYEIMLVPDGETLPKHDRRTSLYYGELGSMFPTYYGIADERGRDILVANTRNIYVGDLYADEATAIKEAIDFMEDNQKYLLKTVSTPRARRRFRRRKKKWQAHMDALRARLAVIEAPG